MADPGTDCQLLEAAVLGGRYLAYHDEVVQESKANKWKSCCKGYRGTHAETW